MRRFIALALALVLLPAGVARAGSIGIGAFGGMSYPVLQDDTGKGTLTGVRVALKFVPLVTLEPYYASSGLTDKVTSVAGIEYTRQGFDEKAYGANVMLAMGGPLSFYPIAGYGQTQLTRSSYDKTMTTYNLGFGLGISPAPKVTIHIRGEMQAVVDGSTSRKFGNATAGVSLALFGMP
jgi:hypothetical protein